MAFDDALAQRIRDQMTAVAGVREKKMFGGLAFPSGPNQLPPSVGWPN